MDYTNFTCPICGGKFGPEDDIVVCPDCGTPHHRSCYTERGACANAGRHSQNYVWEGIQIPEENPASADDNEQPEHYVTCPKCGNPYCTVNSYCDQCGHLILSFELHKDEEEKDPDSFDGISSDRLKEIIGKNYRYYFYHFSSQDRRNSKIALNVPCFLFPSFYFLYRKMKKQFASIFILMLFLNVPCFIDQLMITAGKGNAVFDTISWVLVLFSLVVRVGCALYANWLYRTHCKDLANQESVSERDKGTSLIAVLFLACILALFGYILSLLIL